MALLYFSNNATIVFWKVYYIYLTCCIFFKNACKKSCLMVFNATFNNISVISWRSVLLVEEMVVPGEKHRPVASHWQTLSHFVVHLALIEIWTHNISADRHWYLCTIRPIEIRHLIYFASIINSVIYQQGPSWPWSYGSWIYNYLCNQCLSALMLWVQISI
jgi:hypothetical protein